jgi:hypothetical protein
MNNHEDCQAMLNVVFPKGRSHAHKKITNLGLEFLKVPSIATE